MVTLRSWYSRNDILDLEAFLGFDACGTRWPAAILSQMLTVDSSNATQNNASFYPTIVPGILP